MGQIESNESTIAAATLRSVLKSQYHAALAMLRATLERCPEDVWIDKAPVNAFWQLAYHTLFIGHAYISPNEAAFRPWEHHQADVQHEDGIAGPPVPGSNLPLIPEPYTRAQVLEYWNVCDALIDDAVDALDLHAEDCGFSWYDAFKLEHQFVNIRHH